MNNAYSEAYDQNKNNKFEKLQTNIDAYDYIRNIPNYVWSKINIVVIDPPYYDKGNKEHEEKVNKRSKLKNPTAQWKQPDTRLMYSDKRKAILEFIIDKISDDCYIIYFHTDRSEITTYSDIACEHIWVKPIHYCIAGNADRNNGEHIVIEGPKIEGKPKGRILNKFINARFSRDSDKDNYKPNGSNHIPRACAKPYALYYQLFKHLNAKVILDPFAGFGMSIKAGLHLGAEVYACDKDKNLDYTIFSNIEPNDRLEDTKLDKYFNQELYING